jgi:hypothetical protein
MITETFIDYLQYSIPMKNIDAPHVRISPIANYKIGYRTLDDTRIYMGNALNNKALIVKSGQAMINSRNDGLTDIELLALTIESGGVVSRLDMTIDFYVGDDFLVPKDFLQFRLDGLIKYSQIDVEPTFIGKHNELGSHFETIKFGDSKKRGKKGEARVYDKGIELGLERYLITRVEIEDKREAAHLSATRCIDYGIAPTLKSRFDVINDTWQRGIGASVAPTHRGVEKDKEFDEITRRWLWLFNQVAPALGQAIRRDLDDGRTDRYEHFVELVRKESGVTGEI